MPTLQYLDFEHSDDGSGAATLDALASVPPQHLAPLLAEVAGVLAWMERHHGTPGPLEDGAAWDYALGARREQAQALRAQWDGGGRVALADDGPADPPRTTVSLTLSAAAPLCAQLLADFGAGD
jgi:hypothetical protein